MNWWPILLIIVPIGVIILIIVGLTKKKGD